MQRIHGISVADLNAEHSPLPIGWAAAIAAQVCSVLTVAHQASLVHRDLKPGNLMLQPDGSIKVLDFGLAVALDLAEHSRITHTGQTLGTPAYMAPEQIMASLSGPRTDLYALGCTLHEMLCGQAPFTGPTAYAVMTRQVDERPRPVRSLRPEVPSELEELVLGLLEKKPDDRPATAEAVFERLLPLAHRLGPLPGILTPQATASPVRMYAGVLSRVFAGEPALNPSRPIHPPTPDRDPAPRLSHGELDRARDQATELVRQSRYSQAAEILAAIMEPASRILGNADDEVISLRRDYATVLFEGGDYRRAASQHRQLARDLAARRGADDEQVLHHRLQEATCHALIGETSQALHQLQQLLTDQRRAFGDDDPRTLELRRQIGLLQLGAGQRVAAEETLTQLLTDLDLAHGSEHPTVAAVQDLLASLRQSGRTL